MKRIDIYYNGRDYSVGNRDLDQLLADIDTAASAGEALWLEVNSSFGQARPTLLRVTPSSNIALTMVDSPTDESSTTDPPSP